MKLRDLSAGKVIDLVVTALSGHDPHKLPIWEPLRFEQYGEGVVSLTADGHRILCKAQGRTDQEIIGYIAWPEARLVAVTGCQDDVAAVRIWQYASAEDIPKPLRIEMSEQVLQSVAALTGRAVTTTGAADWAEGEFLLQGRSTDAYRFVTRGNRGDAGFTIIGATRELDVRLTGDQLVAVRVAPRRRGGIESVVLVHARVEFDTGLANDPQAVQIAVSLANSEYVSRWARYNDAEFSFDEEEANKVGSERYDRVTPMPNGAWQIRLVVGSATFVDLIDTGAPLELSDYEGNRATRPRTAVTVAGTVESTDPAAGTIDLRLLPGTEIEPPQRGSVQYSQAGAGASYRRRMNAARRLATASIPLPELASLLELRPTPPRRVDRKLSWDSPAVLAIFAPQRPTDTQIRAIEVALNTPDIAVIQGPPGTGKTKVITAIAARVAEEAPPGTGSRQVLLTSHQNDAVDNVASRTIVFGVPAIRESRDERHGSWLEAHRKDLRDKVDQVLAGYAGGELATLHAWVTNRRDAYYLAPVPAQSAADLLEDVSERCGPHFPPRLAAEFRSTIDHLRSRPASQRKNPVVVAAIRALRTVRAAHDDDGRRNAAALVARLKADTNLLEFAPIHRATGLVPLTDEDFKEIAEARDWLLDRYGLTGPRTVIPARREDVTRLLDAGVDAIAARRGGSGEGAAYAIEGFLNDLETDSIAISRSLAGYASVVAATCQYSHNLAMRIEDTDDAGVVNTVIVDEAARANPLDIQIPMCLASRRVVLVGDQRQLPHIVDDRVLQAVGVTDAEAEEMRESLFGRLFTFLSAQHALGAPQRTVTLNQQFRMHPRLGAFVSEQFYEPAEKVESPLPAEYFSHTLPGYEGRCAVWEQISGTSASRAPGGTSWARQPEAQWIAAEAKRVMEAAPHLTVGIISFYSAQVEALLIELAELGIADEDPDTEKLAIRSSQWRFTADASAQQVERLRVGTVDAFQGKEFDVVFLSAVRTPASAASVPATAFGHLMVANRLCVAMSRQKRLLIVAGDRRRLLEHPLAEQHIAPLCAFARLSDGEAES